MEYTELGSTGVSVSVLSLGAGGASRLGLHTGRSERDARRVVEEALRLGVNLVDTAESYGTEAIVGEAIQGFDREQLVLSTKFSLYRDGKLRPPTDLEESLDRSLSRLGTDYVDVYHLHGVNPEDYDYATERLRPEMERLKSEGTIGHVGITENLHPDPDVRSDSGHDMLARAVEDGGWDVVMVGFNLLNHSARERVLEPAAERGIGTICMAAVRNALPDPGKLEATIANLIESGELDPAEVDPSDPFGFLVREGGTLSLVDAAYRFCRHEPTVDTVLSGTSSVEHLAANVESVGKGPLPEEDLAVLAEQFGDVDSVIGN